MLVSKKKYSLAIKYLESRLDAQRDFINAITEYLGVYIDIPESPPKYIVKKYNNPRKKK